jgi:Zn-dependent peptidase ImmA (M78 family)
MRTKWEILEARIAAAKKELEQLEAQKNWLMTVRFDAECTHCGQELETEADFAKHFLIPDRTSHQHRPLPDRDPGSG